jgi:rSAM/selenodomain-associated transferase 2
MDGVQPGLQADAVPHRPREPDQRFARMGAEGGGAAQAVLARRSRHVDGPADDCGNDPDAGRRSVLSVVIPTLNAAHCLPAALRAVVGADQVIVADGGSTDDTRQIAAQAGAIVVAAARGRGTQLARGIAVAGGDWLLLLHADTRLGATWQAVAAAAMADPSRAGYFRFALDSADPRARRLEKWVAWRCRALGLPYGDQGLLIARSLLERCGGIRTLPLMEDVDVVRRLGRARLVALDAVALTSAARWERDGWHRRSARNLMCLCLWFAGVPPRLIARLYR